MVPLCQLWWEGLLTLWYPSPDSLWGWTEAPPVSATPYEVFDPAATTFGHPQAAQLCYGPSAYSPVGTLEPTPSLETPGLSLLTYPTEDFTGQVRTRKTSTSTSTQCSLQPNPWPRPLPRVEASHFPWLQGVPRPEPAARSAWLVRRAHRAGTRRSRAAMRSQEAEWGGPLTSKEEGEETVPDAR